MGNIVIGVPSAIVRWVRGQDQVLFFRAEVAEALQLSVQTIIDAAKTRPELGPSYKAKYGRARVALYSQADFDALRAFADERWPAREDGSRRGRRGGRPPLWTQKERKERQARQCRVTYLRSQGRRSAECGLGEVAADYRRRADEIKAGLRAEYDERFAYVTGPRVRD